MLFWVLAASMIPSLLAAIMRGPLEGFAVSAGCVSSWLSPSVGCVEGSDVSVGSVISVASVVSVVGDVSSATVSVGTVVSTVVGSVAGEVPSSVAA